MNILKYRFNKTCPKGDGPESFGFVSNDTFTIERAIGNGATVVAADAQVASGATLLNVY